MGVPTSHDSDLLQLSAFCLGCCQVRLNPGGAVNSFAPMCGAIGSWHVSTFYTSLFLFLMMLKSISFCAVNKSLRLSSTSW